MMNNWARIRVLASAGRVRLTWAVALCLVLVAPQSADGQQRNIVFTNVPDFLRLSWEIVLGPDNGGEIVRMPGSVLTGNAIMMLSTKPDPKVVSDYTEMEVETVVQYNLPRPKAATGCITLFQLKAKTGDAIIRPGHNFWTISIRLGGSGPYTSYVAILTGHEKPLREAGLFDRELESQAKLLKELYPSLAKGID
jgi:hypothetical protein